MVRRGAPASQLAESAEQSASSCQHPPASPADAVTARRPKRLIALHDAVLAHLLLADATTGLDGLREHGMAMLSVQRDMTAAWYGRNRDAAMRRTIRRRARVGWVTALLLAFGLGLCLGAAMHRQGGDDAREPAPAGRIAAPALA